MSSVPRLPRARIAGTSPVIATELGNTQDNLAEFETSASVQYPGQAPANSTSLALPTDGQSLGYEKSAGPIHSHPLQKTAAIEAPPAPFFPQPNLTYVTRNHWRGAEHPINVRFGADMAEFLVERNIRVDLVNATFVRDGVEPEPWFPPKAREAYATLNGHPAPPWLVFLSEAELLGDDAPKAIKDTFALPTDIELTSFGPRLESGEIVRLRRVFDKITELNVFRWRRHTDSFESTQMKSSLEPLGISESSMASRTLAPGINVSGLTNSSIKLAEQAIHDILGPTLSSLSQTQKAAADEHRVMTAMRNELLQAQRSLNPQIENAAIARARLLLPHAAIIEGSTIGRALSAMNERQSAIEKILNLDVEIIVFPAGKHWTAMPQWDSQRRGLESSESSLAVTTGTSYTDDAGDVRNKRLVFVPEDRPNTQRHELYHLLEKDFLPPEQLAVIDQAYRHAVENLGPFAAPYGAQRREFFTTWAELFEGAGGAPGISFLKDNAFEIYELLTQITGRSP